MVGPLMLPPFEREKDLVLGELRKSRIRTMMGDSLLACTTVCALAGLLSRCDDAARNETVTGIAIGLQERSEYAAVRHEGKSLRVNGDLEFKVFHPLKGSADQEIKGENTLKLSQTALYEFTLTHEGKVIRLFIPSGLTAHATLYGIELSERNDIGAGLNCLDSAKNRAFNRRGWVDGTVQMTEYGLGLFANTVFIAK